MQPPRITAVHTQPHVTLPLTTPTTVVHYWFRVKIIVIILIIREKKENNITNNKELTHVLSCQYHSSYTTCTLSQVSC